jgi:hypothetical protein
VSSLLLDLNSEKEEISKKQDETVKEAKWAQQKQLNS